MRTEPFDDRLPILDEIGEQLERHAVARLPAAAPRRSLGRALRVPRRAVLLALLSCLVGATATAAVSLLDGGRAASTADPQVLFRLGEPDPGRLELLGRRDRACLALILETAADTACLTGGGPRSVRPRSLATATSRVIYVLTGPRVPAVEIVAERRRGTVATRPVGILGARWALARVDRVPGRTRPVLVRGVDGRQRGATVRDCSSGGCR